MIVANAASSCSKKSALSRLNSWYCAEVQLTEATAGVGLDRPN